ncbi:DNA-binding protein [Larkinella rosea]|uniref:DNA-binding protein n=2 Tax=Larkinella rosea TaxID=2025312 RepID=A0A3P1BLS9_9BACT|nr:DNA-binding protein [Larkinella rosea]
MCTITFEQLPSAIAQLLSKVDRLESLLMETKPSCVPEEDKLITIHQAAEILDLSVTTIYGLVHRREVPHQKKRKRLYFSKPELLDWARSGRRKTNAEIDAEVNTYLSTKKRA